MAIRVMKGKSTTLTEAGIEYRGSQEVDRIGDCGLFERNFPDLSGEWFCIGPKWRPAENSAYLVKSLGSYPWQGTVISLPVCGLVVSVRPHEALVRLTGGEHRILSLPAGERPADFLNKMVLCQLEPEGGKCVLGVL